MFHIVQSRDRICAGACAQEIAYSNRAPRRGRLRVLRKPWVPPEPIPHSEYRQRCAARKTEDPPSIAIGRLPDPWERRNSVPETLGLVVGVDLVGGVGGVACEFLAEFGGDTRVCERGDKGMPQGMEG